MRFAVVAALAASALAWVACAREGSAPTVVAAIEPSAVDAGKPEPTATTDAGSPRLARREEGRGADDDPPEPADAGPRPRGSHQTRAPSLRQGKVVVTGKLATEVVQRIVRQNFGRFRLCYEAALRVEPARTGKVTVKLTIDGTGAVSASADGGSDVGDPTLVACVVRATSNLAFPEPDDKMPVTVLYPVLFMPGD